MNSANYPKGTHLSAPRLKAHRLASLSADCLNFKIAGGVSLWRQSMHAGPKQQKGT